MHSQNQKYVFLFGIIFILAVVIGTAFFHERIVQSGTEVILETRPVDPRDLFRGEYVTLRYAIEEDRNVTFRASTAEAGDKLYILLSKDPSGIARVSEVHTERPTGELVGPWIVGEVGRYGDVRFPSIEQYYVPEGMGRPIEDLREELHVRVRLKDGEARAVELLDGSLEPIDRSIRNDNGSE